MNIREQRQWTAVQRAIEQLTRAEAELRSAWEAGHVSMEVTEAVTAATQRCVEARMWAKRCRHSIGNESQGPSKPPSKQPGAV